MAATGTQVVVDVLEAIHRLHNNVYELEQLPHQIEEMQGKLQQHDHQLENYMGRDIIYCATKILKWAIQKNTLPPSAPMGEQYEDDSRHALIKDVCGAFYGRAVDAGDLENFKVLTKDIIQLPNKIFHEDTLDELEKLVRLCEWRLQKWPVLATQLLNQVRVINHYNIIKRAVLGSFN